MKTLDRRICKLEDRFGTGNSKPQLVFVIGKAGWGLPLDLDQCIQILAEGRFLPTGPIGVVNLGQTPSSLNAADLEMYLRNEGSWTRGLMPWVTRLASEHGTS